MPSPSATYLACTRSTERAICRAHERHARCIRQSWLFSSSSSSFHSTSILSPVVVLAPVVLLARVALICVAPFVAQNARTMTNERRRDSMESRVGATSYEKKSFSSLVVVEREASSSRVVRTACVACASAIPRSSARACAAAASRGGCDLGRRVVGRSVKDVRDGGRHRPTSRTNPYRHMQCRKWI